MHTISVSYRSGRQLPEYRKTVKGVEHFIVLLESSEGVGEKGGKKKEKGYARYRIFPRIFSLQRWRIWNSGGTNIMQKLLALISRIVEPKFRPGRPFLGPL